MYIFLIPTLNYKFHIYGISFYWVLLSNSVKKKKNTDLKKAEQTGLREPRAVRLAAFLCALAVFWCEIPWDPYMVKAKSECEAEGSVICYHSQRLQQEKQSIIQMSTQPGGGEGMCVMQEGRCKQTQRKKVSWN